MSSPEKSPILIIFDVDGTLIDANAIDDDCFNRAFHETTGISLPATTWSQFNEITGQAIVHQALGEAWPDIPSTATQIKDTFLTKLRLDHSLNPGSIRALAGADDLIFHLKKSPEFSVAIATGCWKETAHFKLRAAGLDFSDIPFASASDCYSRAEIISLAAKRASVPLEQAIYVGDGLWDLRATQQLGIPFIGVGQRVETLRQAGAEHTLDSLNADALSHVLRQICSLRGAVV